MTQICIKHCDISHTGIIPQKNSENTNDNSNTMNLHDGSYQPNMRIHMPYSCTIEWTRQWKLWQSIFWSINTLLLYVTLQKGHSIKSCCLRFHFPYTRSTHAERNTVCIQNHLTATPSGPIPIHKKEISLSNKDWKIQTNQWAGKWNNYNLF